MSFMPISDNNAALAAVLRGVQGGGMRSPGYSSGNQSNVMYGSGANDPYMAQQAADPRSAANTALGQFGLSLPQNPNPFIMFNNNPGSFAQNHPGVAGALDNAAGVLANMGPTSMSAGDNISNVARGLMGNRAMHQQYLMQQYQAPFAIAGQLSGLQAQQDAHTLAQAHANYFNQLGQGRANAGQAALDKTDPHNINGSIAQHKQELQDAGLPPMTAQDEIDFRSKLESTYAISDAAGKTSTVVAGKQADPYGARLDAKDAERKALNLPPMTFDERQKERDNLVGMDAVAAAQGKKVVKQATSGGGAYKIDPRDKQAHDDAQKDLQASQKELANFTKAKGTDPATYYSPAPSGLTGDAEAQRLQSVVNQKQQVFQGIKDKIQGKGSKTSPTQPSGQHWNPIKGEYE